MNDHELITAVRESFTDVHSATPVEQIVNRSRARARRRIPILAGSLAVAVGVVVAAAATLLPASTHTSARLAAWTVVKQADGTVSVTIRELRDPAGLQSKLRANGVPASVSFSGETPRACRKYPVKPAMMDKVFSGQMLQRFPVMIIHVSVLPHGAGVAISPPDQQPNTTVKLGLVYASPQCIGN